MGRLRESLLLGVTGLEIGLAVEIDGLNVGDARGIACAEEHEVAGDMGLVGGDAHELADTDLVPWFGFEGGGDGGEYGSKAGVFGAVGEAAAVVFVGVFEGGDGEDEGEGEDGGCGGEDAELGDLVDADEDEEVDVGDAVELFEEVFGEESKGGVFGSVDRVAGVLDRGIAADWVVDEDEAGVRFVEFGLFLGGIEGAAGAESSGERMKRRFCGRRYVDVGKVEGLVRRARGGDEERFFGSHGGRKRR